jgi:hypothetical protein
MSEWRGEYGPFVSVINDMQLRDCEVEERIRNGGPSARDLYMTRANHNPARKSDLFAMLPEDDQAHVSFVEAQLEGVLQRLTTILT